MNSTKWIVAAALAVVAAVPGAQQPGFTRALLQDQPLSTSGYVVEGTLELLIEGQPPKTLKAGEVFFVHADNDFEATGTDEYYLHRLRVPPPLVTAGGGQAAKVV